MDKRIVAKLAALSLLLTALPAAPVQAVQMPEPSAEESVWEETGGTDDNDITQEEAGDGVTNDTAQEEAGDGVTDGTAQIETVEAAKAAGSSGILHDGVAYLSERNVQAMDMEMQEAYRALCDDIEAGMEEGIALQDTVLAVDGEGNLYCSYYVPMRSLYTLQEKFLPDTEGTLLPGTENGQTTDSGNTEDNEDPSEDSAAADGGTTDGDTEESENPSGDSDGTGADTADGETADGGTRDDGNPAGDSDGADTDTEDGETAGGDTKNDEDPSGDSDADGADTADSETADGGTRDDENLSGDSDADGADAADGETADGDTEESENPSEDSDETNRENADGVEAADDEASPEETGDGEHVEAPYEENLDRIADPAGETFEPVPPARVEDMPLPWYGYGGLSSGESGAGGVQLYSILPKDNYFSAQLTSNQKKYYKAAEKELTTGNYQFSLKASLSLRETSTADVAHAVSALLLACPEKMDWLSKPGGFHGNVVYRKGAKTGTYTFSFVRSAFYKPELDTRANSRVQEIGREAISYAEKNYPDAPVYGIVKYYDQWVCENGYYENIGAKAEPAETEREVYYNCHSAYGILLNGYGVCESYSKTLARLLDAVGIPNIYAVGTAGGSGHSWNYIQMPDGAWYLLDSTWNDNADKAHTTSDGTWLLKKGDGSHQPSGCYYAGEKPDFKFPAMADGDYTYKEFALTEAACDLVAKEKHQLSCNKAVTGYWTSSNTKAAKVDKKGNVTAVAGGTAVITFAGQGMTGSCTVNVDQVKSLKTADGGKTSASLSLAAEGTETESRDIRLTADMGASPHTAQWMVENGKTAAPQASSRKTDIAEASVSLTDNTLTVHVQAKQAGSTDVTVKFAGKTVKVRVTTGIPITPEMFDVTWPAGVTGEEGNRTVPYTGKAVKPKVKKKTDESYKPVRFKVSYMGNTNAGNAKVVITGTGKYGGTIEYPFTITKTDLSEAVFSKTLKDKPYNGGTNPPAVSVKLGKKTLKAGRDYELLYTGMGFVKEQPAVLPAGSYTVTARGIGNYTGEMKAAQPYTVTQNTIAKVSVAGAGSVKHTGIPQKPYTVKIGKNILPATDYEIVWYVGQGKTKRETPMTTAPAAKGKYTAVVTVKGDNLTTTAKKKEIVKKFTIK